MNRRTTLTLTALTAPALALVLSASSSSASTTGADTDAAVAQAVTTSPLTAGVPAGSFTVGDVRVAGTWAAADLQPTDPDALDPATAVLRSDGTRWTVVDLGTAGVGCDVVPVTDRAALALSC
ncbi:hypothetical protein AB1207_19535 [Kineococcus endophyticus]|uniref:Secreted protein n=1 Tax=Kineococcus endophyticus TaxID=1181883 RepID=A0ABV3PC37_9ACTN